MAYVYIILIQYYVAAISFEPPKSMYASKMLMFRTTCLCAGAGILGIRKFIAQQ